MPSLSLDTPRMVLQLFRLHSGLTIMEQAVLFARLPRRSLFVEEDKTSTCCIAKKRYRKTRKNLPPSKLR